MKLDYELTDRQYYSILRKIKNIKLKEISEVLGCTFALISLWETGKGNMNEDFVKVYKEIIDNK